MNQRRAGNITLLGFLLLGGIFGFINPANAQGTNLRTGPLLIQCDTTTIIDGKVTIDPNNTCGIDDFLNQFVILAQFGMSIVAFLAVLMLVYGGFQWITAAGRPSKVEEGKRVMAGTIVGVIISLIAYIIVNFTVSAITGTQTRLNFFGAVATVFSNPEGREERINRPFSGTGGSGAGQSQTCHTQWDTGCSDQIRCADRDRNAGAVRDLQTKLEAKGCSCGGIDGCFGNGTANCVRSFQLANNLPPTGMVDQRTRTAIESQTSITCSSEQTRISLVNSRLPTYNVNAAANVSATTLGCCLVKGNVNNNSVTLQCANHVSQRTCAALGANNKFFPGINTCYQIPEAQGECGFCVTNRRCFQGATPTWCEQTDPLLLFQNGPCFGVAQCGGTPTAKCVDTLYGSSNF